MSNSWSATILTLLLGVVLCTRIGQARISSRALDGGNPTGVTDPANRCAPDSVRVMSCAQASTSLAPRTAQ